jgi:hypothetical protein
LDDGSKNVDVSVLQFNGRDTAFVRCTPTVKSEIKQLFINAALEEANAAE